MTIPLATSSSKSNSVISKNAKQNRSINSMNNFKPNENEKIIDTGVVKIIENGVKPLTNHRNKSSNSNNNKFYSSDPHLALNKIAYSGFFY